MSFKVQDRFFFFFPSASQIVRLLILVISGSVTRYMLLTLDNARVFLDEGEGKWISLMGVCILLLPSPICFVDLPSLLATLSTLPPPYGRDEAP